MFSQLEIWCTDAFNNIKSLPWRLGVHGNVDVTVASSGQCVAHVVMAATTFWSRCWNSSVSLHKAECPLSVSRREVETDPDSGFETSDCSQSQLSDYNSVTKCGALSDSAGPFAACHAIFPPKTYQEWVDWFCVCVCIKCSWVFADGECVCVFFQRLFVWPVCWGRQWGIALCQLRSVRSSLSGGWSWTELLEAAAGLW